MKQVISIIVVLLAYSLVLALPVQFLWNFALLPAVEGLYPIGFLQAIGINLLASILFKNATPSEKDNKDAIEE